MPLHSVKLKLECKNCVVTHSLKEKPTTAITPAFKWNEAILNRNIEILKINEFEYNLIIDFGDILPKEDIQSSILFFGGLNEKAILNGMIFAKELSRTQNSSLSLSFKTDEISTSVLA